MGRVKIFVDENESIESVETDLYKALDHHVSGNTHDGEKFDDPAMNDVANHMISAHDKMYDEMMKDIIQELEKEHAK